MRDISDQIWADFRHTPSFRPTLRGAHTDMVELHGVPVHGRGSRFGPGEENRCMTKRDTGRFDSPISPQPDRA